MISVVESGLVYRNPVPHLRAVHALHPTVALRDDGALIACFDLGQAVESLDYRTWYSHSTDQARSWSPPKWVVAPDSAVLSNDVIRMSRLRDGTLVGFGGRFYRDRPEEGFVNRECLGYVRMELFLVRSNDGGASWRAPEIITPPLVGPSFEICHPIVELSDGRWLAPTSTWKGWNGDAPNGMQAVALVSHDQGATWPEWIAVSNQYAQGIISWEIGLTELEGGRLLTVVWSFDERQGRSLPSRYAVSPDGRTFEPSRENGLLGETAKLLTLKDGRVLCLYRRLDQPGLWANLVEIRGNAWINLAESVVWRGADSRMDGHQPAADELSHLKFGCPNMVQLPDGDVLVVFWCLEDEVRNIRWARLRWSTTAPARR